VLDDIETQYHQQALILSGQFVLGPPLKQLEFRMSTVSLSYTGAAWIHHDHNPTALRQFRRNTPVSASHLAQALALPRSRTAVQGASLLKAADSHITDLRRR
jgi:hypothetical protein